MGYIDMHCDTLMAGLFTGASDIYEIENTHVNLKKLIMAGAEAQFFAAFFPRREKGGFVQCGKMLTDQQYFDAMRALFLESLRAHSEEVSFAGSPGEFLANKEAGKVSAFLTIEDGRAVNGSFDVLQKFYERGVRLITLTWNDENCFGAPNSKDPVRMQKGLTDFGKEAIEFLNQTGIIIDVSHLSDGGFWDVAARTGKPFVASHSNARSLSPHPRNLTDEMIRALAEKGGVAGLNLYGAFLQRDAVTEHSTIERMVAHVKHVYRIGGEDVIGIGTDFDGIGGELEIREPRELERLFAALQKAGLTARILDKFQHGNVERVILNTL